ncbi:AMIN domain-containing protein [Fundidesulfovibrio putealis]|uniref:AMIN domain-containing protein n=1 Tax=Fundidesulfovibrio putealis TaxID=270496 RepID=UPI0005B92DE0|nr:AMIN domain-containing protein [Fundidesulfovibrio putealis]
MADRKNPLFLRIMIVVVALLLGFSLNMFQFRNPFRSLDTDSASNAQFPDKSRFPSRQETTLPVSPVAKPPQPEAAAVKEDKPELPQTVAKAEPKKDVAPAPAPADPPVPAPQPVAEATAEKQGAPVSITVEHESPSLGLPKVTSDAAKAKAAKIGRQVATGVAESKPEPKAVADASAPAPAAPPVPSKDDKAANAPTAGKAEQQESGKTALQEQAIPESGTSTEKTDTAKPAQLAEQGAQTAPATAEPVKSAPAPSPSPAETGTPAAPTSQTAQAPKAPSGEKAAAQASQKSTSGPDGPAAVQTSQASQPGLDVNAVPGKSSKAQASKPAQSDQPAAKTPQPLAGVSPAASSGASTPSEKALPDEKPAAAKGTRILEIKTQDKPGEFVLTIVTDGPVEKVTSFHAKGPARLAVDLQGSWQSALGASTPVEGELFERIRLGAHPDKLRLVIDYRDKELSAFSEQIVEKQPKGVVVRIPKAKPKP